jgi:hypothetical protein
MINTIFEDIKIEYDKNINLKWYSENNFDVHFKIDDLDIKYKSDPKIFDNPIYTSDEYEETTLIDPPIAFAAIDSKVTITEDEMYIIIHDHDCGDFLEIKKKDIIEAKNKNQNYVRISSIRKE